MILFLLTPFGLRKKTNERYSLEIRVVKSPHEGGKKFRVFFMLQSARIFFSYLEPFLFPFLPLGEFPHMVDALMWCRSVLWGCVCLHDSCLAVVSFFSVFFAFFRLAGGENLTMGFPFRFFPHNVFYDARMENVKTERTWWDEQWLMSCEKETFLSYFWRKKIHHRPRGASRSHRQISFCPRVYALPPSLVQLSSSETKQNKKRKDKKGKQHTWTHDFPFCKASH